MPKCAAHVEGRHQAILVEPVAQVRTGIVRVPLTPFSAPPPAARQSRPRRGSGACSPSSPERRRRWDVPRFSDTQYWVAPLERLQAIQQVGQRDGRRRSSAVLDVGVPRRPGARDAAAATPRRCAAPSGCSNSGRRRAIAIPRRRRVRRARPGPRRRAWPAPPCRIAASHRSPGSRRRLRHGA